jgi:uncharacterized coiled-coil protein SlyX
VFVILLVITSMLTTAGTVVFVTKAQKLQPALDAAAAAKDAAIAKAEHAAQEAATAQGQYNQEVALHQSDRTKDALVVTQVQNNLNDLNVRVAQLEQEKASRDSQITTLTNNLALATTAGNKLQEQVSTLRADNDKYVAASEDDNKRISELTNTSETVQAKLSDTTEKLSAAQEIMQKYEGWIKDHAGDPTAIAQGPGGVGPGAPAISGSIRDKNVINGNTYVTIDVGSADGVAKGMQFYVLDRTSGAFLAMVTIDSVDSHDAVGRLQGDADKVPLVRAGNDVKTQLRGF